MGYLLSQERPVWASLHLQNFSRQKSHPGAIVMPDKTTYCVEQTAIKPGAKEMYHPHYRFNQKGLEREIPETHRDAHGRV